MKNSGKKYSFYSNNNLSLRSVSESKYESQINYIEIIKEKDKEIKKLQKELFYLKKYNSNVKQKKNLKNASITNQFKKTSFEINNISYYDKLFESSNTPKKNYLNYKTINLLTPKKNNYSKNDKTKISLSKINLNKKKNHSIEINKSNIYKTNNSNIIINDYKFVFQSLLDRTNNLFQKINGKQ